MVAVDLTSEEQNLQQLPQSNIQNRTIDFIFSTAKKMCDKEEAVADYTHETGSMKATRLCVAMVLKYMPKEIKDEIKKLYDVLYVELDKIDKSTMDDANKKQNKMKMENDVCMEILTLCLVTLTYSSIETELREIKIIGNFEELIKKVRSKNPTDIFIKEDD
jgi:hypothetical protein